jgi:eukaryotic-like serine/threonine-protein kinase
VTNPKICPTCGASYSPDNLFCPLDSAPLRLSGDEAELIGSILAGRYLISEQLGVGGMGTVYRAQDVRLQRRAAIKVLHAGLTRDPEALARFSREASNASQISNSHVVQVYDVGEIEGGAPYLAMEFVPGSSLRKLLDREAPLTPSRAASLIGQIARGLDAAHRIGIVHRDLKPDNILMTEDEAGEEVAKVADFGISKAIRDDSQHITRTGYVTGTYEFMSPEQVTGGATDQRSDVYALGLIAFLMLTGKLPFPGSTAEHSMLLRLTEPPRTLRNMRPETTWPEELQRVLDSALAREPGGRCGSAGQFARDLAAAVDAWQPPAAVAPPRRWGGRWVRLGVGVVAAVVLVALATWLWPGDGEDRVGNFPPLPPIVDSSKAIVETGPQPPPTESGDASDTVSGSSKPEPPPTTDSLPRGPVSADRGGKQSTGKTGPVHQPRPQPSRGDRDAGSESGLAFGLGPFDTILHPDMSRDSALLTLRTLDALKSRLRTRRDSVEADLYRAEAYALAGEEERACAILEAARPRASTLQRKKIALWVEQGLCTGPAWQPS